MNLSVLYRGLLTSCNYGCGYCPFAKRTESDRRLAEDKAAVTNFAEWLCQQSTHRWRILFTPWGEALVRSWYRGAISKLTRLPQIECVAAQTNLSCGLDWLAECEVKKLTLWVTFHPTEVERARFVQRVLRLHELGIRLCVGTVAITSNFHEIASLRTELPEEIYLWINPQQPRSRPYSTDELQFLSAIDPHFLRLLRPRATMGQPCRTGSTSFTVDGAGDMRRCHFVEEVIGNIHAPGWEDALQPRMCPNRSCHCYLGLSHFEPLEFDQIFGPNVLDRIPLEIR